jgi:arginyl-tRNA synthetase
MKKNIKVVIKELWDIDIEPEVTRPPSKFGDYSTNVSFTVSNHIDLPAKTVAQHIVDNLSNKNIFKKITVDGAGFINIFASDEYLIRAIGADPDKIYENKKFVFEYSCPNAFKELHVGHLYQTIYGDITGNLMELGGAKLQRTSFGGDVGLHVAKCLWGMRSKLGGGYPENLDKISMSPFERSKWISSCYVLGAKKYESSDVIKTEIDELNKTIYNFHTVSDHSSPLAKIYWTTRDWCFEYFDSFYELIGVQKMRYYPESETASIGLEVVRNQLKQGNLISSQGAIVFKGDKNKNLHTRVFITSKGLPTYETKDIGVIWMEEEEYNFDHRFLITGNDQKEYMRVVFAAAETFKPDLKGKMTHMTNGAVKFADGKKMSSRLGNVSRAIDVLKAVQNKVELLVDDPDVLNKVTLGAVKYTFAKYSLGKDISFNLEDTVTLNGNSGPYLQYSHARAMSILSKLDYIPNQLNKINPEDRAIIRKLGEYTDSLNIAIKNLQPHYICNYLFEVAQEFNRYYEVNRIIGSKEEKHRSAIVKIYSELLENGLGVLGIDVPGRM